MDKKTKIVATLGPSSEDPIVLKNLIKAGVNVFRFNLKHNTHGWHKKLLKTARKISEKEKISVATLADLQGPELRIGIFPNDLKKITLYENAEVYLCKSERAGKTCIPFNNIDVIEGLEPGHSIYIDDGKFELIVVKIGKDYIKADVKYGGELGIRKSISIPQAKINLPSLTKKDKVDVKFAVEAGFDFVALSFVRDETDIATLQVYLKRLKGRAKIVAKIETLKAVENIESIIDKSDAIMIARGDLGVEIPIERVPKIQRHMISLCRQKSKPVIVATQMLASMINKAYPSRAEVADIANSVFDKVDALMLSEESAIGSFPVEAVKTMAKIARYNEDFESGGLNEFQPKSFQEIIIASSVRFSIQKPHDREGVKGYMVFTESGRSARSLSRFRPAIPIYAFSRHRKTIAQLPLSYGVEAHYMKLSSKPITNIQKALELLRDKRAVEKGDKIIVIFGSNVGVEEGNNALSIVTA